jgi:hypothetical protein
MGDTDIKKDDQPRDVANRVHVTSQDELASQVETESDPEHDDLKKRELENAGGRTLTESPKP